MGHSKVEELQQQQVLSEDVSADSAPAPSLAKNLMNEDDMKAYALDAPVSVIFYIISIINKETARALINSIYFLKSF